MYINKTSKILNKLLIKVYRRYLKTLGYSKYLSKYLFRIVQFGIYISLCLILIDIIGLFLGQTDNLGPFGDFLGGTLNPIFTFLMLIGLVITIVLQKIELSLARKEFQRSSNALESQGKNLEYQRFENTFFKLLELLEASRNDVYYVRRISSDEYSGRDAIHKIYRQFTQDFLHDTQLLNMREPYATALGDGKKYFRDDCKKVAGIKKRYGNFYLGKNGEDLGQYFRTLYNILKFIDNNKEIDNKKLYTNLLRAQLSRYELALLFYNCLSDFGEQKMAPLVKKYEILKHLEERTIPPENIDIWREFMHNEQLDDGRGDSPRL